MENIVDVNLGERSYQISVSESFKLNADLFGGAETKVLVVTDTNVDPLYGDKFEEQLADAGLNPYRLVLPAGEKTKDFEFLRKVYDRALECGLDRGSTIAALGGGVVGDLAGFAAATYLRGIRLVQVPTTLLSMVDSSVGGKTGLNIAQGKNLVGSFYQPSGVIINLETLDTLPSEEYACGLSEVVKYGVIYDSALFSVLENSADAILALDREVMSKVISRCCQIKAEVVGIDEKESGLRAILNFGHTFGHALENLSGYGQILHGQAVSIGMVYAAVLSSAVKGFSSDGADRLKALLVKYGLPVSMAGGSCEGLDWNDIRDVMLSDKKTRNAVIKFVLAESIGSVSFGCEVSEEVLEAAFGKM